MLGKQPMIPALEEAVSTMKPGGIRQVGTPRCWREGTPDGEHRLPGGHPPHASYMRRPTRPPIKPTPQTQVIVPPELGYPSDDPEHDRVGPKPSTFSGQRALDFVLKNQGLVDKVCWCRDRSCWLVGWLVVVAFAWRYVVMLIPKKITMYIQQTLLINVELKRVDKPGERGFKG